MAIETAEETAARGSRSQMKLHEALATYIEEQTGEKLKGKAPAEIIALAFAFRNEWRATDDYAALKAEIKDGAKPAKKAASKAPAKKAAAKKAPAKKAAAKKGKGDDPFA